MTSRRYRGSLAVWMLLLAYASLYPSFSLRLPAADAHAIFFSARQVIRSDVAFNVVAYIPLGTLACLYLRNQGLTLSEIGTPDSRATGGDDGCRASCVDWYGNSRPLFLKNRVFALMGYELVEGRLQADKIIEARRIDFAPRRSNAVIGH